MTDWLDATDPVPARRELTDALVQRMRAERQLRRLRKKKFKPTTIGTAWVDEGFEEMGA